MSDKLKSPRLDRRPPSTPGLIRRSGRISALPYPHLSFALPPQLLNNLIKYSLHSPHFFVILVLRLLLLFRLLF
jgi:hypothetical protein